MQTLRWCVRRPASSTGTWPPASPPLPPALSLACKMHTSDEANVATAKVMSLVLSKVPRPAMIHLEVEVSCRLDWHLNPPTSPVVIHHLASFLPSSVAGKPSLVEGLTNPIKWP